MTHQPSRNLEPVYWLVAVIVLAILCSCSDKEEYGPDLRKFAHVPVQHSYHDYQQFTELNK